MRKFLVAVQVIALSVAGVQTLDAQDRPPNILFIAVDDLNDWVGHLGDDHGWHLGQKQHWRKHTLWEVAARTTLIISSPARGQRGVPSPRPVSLIDLYPTLVELSGVPSRSGLDGQSLVPLLKNPLLDWPRPVLTTYGYGNHSVRTERWCYIEYHDGGQELYDHDADPNEWTNLASRAEYASIVDELARFVPRTNAR